MSEWDLPPDMGLAQLADEWLRDIDSTIDPETADLYRLHVRTHLAPHFGDDPRAIKAESVAAYGRARLRVVKRATLQKERSTLRGLLDWCEERGYLVAPIALPKLPKRALGTPWEQRRRGKATELSPEECRRVIAALPQWTRPHGERPSFAVRARFVVAWETALRPATLDALSVPEHYSRGADSLEITDEIDKARFGRRLPLTAAARAALDSVCRPGHVGQLFGEHDYRWQLAKAARAVLSPAKSRTFTGYDFRHSRLTELAESGNLTGTAYLAGHRRVTTTAIYVRPGLRAGERALDQAERSRASNATLLAGERKPLITMRLCEGEDSNLHGVSPASTSIHRKSTHQLGAHAPRHEAISILASIADGQAVSEDRVKSLALSAIGLTPLGRLALAVLESGADEPRRVAELARMLAEGQAEGGDRGARKGAR